MRLDLLKQLRSREGRAAALAAVRAWSKAHPKRAAVAAVAGLLALGWMYDHAVGRGVQVIDGSTGRPLEGVYAIWHWGGSPPISFTASSACSRIRVARTDAEGRYRVPYWSWTIRSLFLINTGSGALYYYPGYYKATPTEADDNSKVELWPDTRSVQDRLMAIRQDQRTAQCKPFEDGQQRKMLEPVYEAMWKEAESIAETPMHRVSSKSVRWMYNLLRFGEPEATRIERQLEGRKP